MRDFFDNVSKFFSDQFASGSQEAHNINALFLQFLILAAIIIVLIAGLVFLSVIRFREKKRPEEPVQIFGNKKLEITWTLLPLLAVTFFFVLTVKTMLAIGSTGEKNRQPDIIITARQWWWDIKYIKDNVRAANELHIPAGKKLLIEFESPDVIHDWWVQELGPKMDVIPGQKNYLWISADKAGSFEGVCSEYCGTQHAWMRILVVAENQNDFDKWIKDQKSFSSALDERGKPGALLFQKKTCVSCHSIQGISDSAYIGPDLTHLASRKTLLSGMLPNTKENLKIWLKDPQKLKSGANMPNFNLSPDELESMVSFLEEMK